MNRKKIYTGLLLAAFLLLSNCCCQLIRASVKLPGQISHGMILQRDTALKIWGWASAGEPVNVEFLNVFYKTSAKEDGNWMLEIPAQKAGGPYEMKVNDIIIKDILIGDVWLCSGQSNMELPVRRVADLYKQETDTAYNPFIRQFKVPLKYDFEKASDDLTGGSWTSVTPENVLDFSATAYFFAKDLYDKYRIPIGLINSAVGGSPVEAWISKDNLKYFPSYLAVSTECATPGYIDSVRTSDNKRMHEWFSELNERDSGVTRWFAENMDDSDWDTIYLPGYWADKGIGNINGSFWFRKDFEIPETLAGKSAVLRLGCIVDSDSAYINGHFIGTVSYQYPPRIYNIPAGILKKGKNNITIRVINSGGKGGFVEDKPYRIVSAGEYIDLTGEWKYKIGAKMPSLSSQTFFQYKPMGLYNGMIAPNINYAIKGIIWYQGESNTDNTDDYKKLFPSLIKDWREKWGNPSLPFLYVQLPGFMETEEQPSDGKWARMREVQMQSLNIPYTAMSVITDVGEWNDIHPLNKKVVGHRLALTAMRTAYKEYEIISSGPIYKDMKVRDDKIVLSFIVEGKGIALGEELRGFAIAGEDRRFVWAKARIEGNNIVVWNDNVKNPVAVRYAWADNPANANLKNKEGLQASPFRTDNW